MSRLRSSRASRQADTSAGRVQIPDKLYFRIGEVSDLTETKSYVLRYWETEFPSLRPVKSHSGHRRYRRQDVELVLEIRRLLYQKGFTIEGARKQLSNHAREDREGKSAPDGSQLKAIRRELQSVLTILSRK